MTLYAYRPRRLPEALGGLFTLALDLRWSWHHGSDRLWQALDEDTWNSTRNAWLVLNGVSGERLDMLSHDPDFLQRLQAQLTAHAAFTRAETWYSEAHPGKLERGVAFFCMEYGLSESLPLYSGGLGVLAGDYLKAASDLGVPVTAVGLLYQQGYFRQAISADGEQLEFYPYNDPTMLPLSPLRDEDDGWLRVTVPLPGRDVRLRAWIGQVGRCELLLLDSNDPRNEPGDRGITSELYSGDPEKRLQQEMMLGIGGWRLLRKLKRDPAVCHINEGHCALALVERALSWGRDNERDFETARSATRVSNLFTTHTSVAAGFDRFPRRQLELYLAPWLAQSDLSVEQLVALGVHDDDRDATGDPLLNMGRLALAMSGRVNAVSRIHQQVSQTIFQPFFPRWPRQDIPVEYVTNGVHTPSWDSPESDELWTGACGQDRWCRPMETLEPLAEVSDQTLWHMRLAQRRRLIHYLRQRLASQHCAHHPGGNTQAACGLLLDSETLTLGFARRFTEYKRPDLLLSDEARLVRLLSQRDRPVQIVLAGKAHPHDHTGKALIQRWKRFSRRPEVEGRVVFIEDYDLGVANQLVQGVDVWLNTPRHPWEACGTSGMKVLVNGGLNVSQFDGWWAEAWRPEVGWAIRPGATFEELSHTNDHDASDALELFELLENEVIPAFYDVNADGLPEAWLARVRTSMNTLTATYSANRMVRQYVEDFYLPMSENGRQRTAAVAQALVEQSRQIAGHWPRIRFTGMEVQTLDGEQQVTVDVYLDGLDERMIRVELVAEASEFGPRLVQPMAVQEALPGSGHTWVYQCRVPARPKGHYTPRIVVGDNRLTLPLEDASVIWMR
ncbi:alpha-glucan phosphorylase [Marinobacter lutaoensis]|jgi:starch phosphorylase|uniref:Alpha-glucan phosphorylase n=1 Tax=Marinobacter lutaoensis TaxID=135739 RepID=A0A1V2DU57_9GAMM|nr:alpha-glucan family phosphorylase [Marinobacter lutaoensis]ONF44107.1 alpha-glucan phosphorylase [Marinobacter lutaoensis]